MKSLTTHISMQRRQLLGHHMFSFLDTVIHPQWLNMFFPPPPGIMQRQGPIRLFRAVALSTSPTLLSPSSVPL